MAAWNITGIVYTLLLVGGAGGYVWLLMRAWGRRRARRQGCDRDCDRCGHRR